MRASLLSVFAAAGAAFTQPVWAADELAWTVTDPQVYSSSSLGWYTKDYFTVGPQDVTLSALGVFDGGSDGFANSGVGVLLYDQLAPSTLITSVLVKSTDPLVDYYRFSAVDPITLQAGHQYYLYASIFSEPYNVGGGPASVNTSITWDRSQLCVSGPMPICYPEGGGGVIPYTPPFFTNFLISSDAGGVPEPGTWAMMLFGFGMIGASLRSHRRKLSVR